MIPKRYLLGLALAVACTAMVPLFARPDALRFDSRVLYADFEVDAAHYSNILPQDYVGTAACAECHEEQFALWDRHPHSKMNQLPTPQSVMGDFDNAVMKLPDGEVRFTTEFPSGQDSSGDGSRNPQYFMSVYRGEQLVRRSQVTRTVGSRYIQSYIGRQLSGPESADHDIYREHKLPWSYRFRMNRWLPGSYFNICCDEPQVDGISSDETVDQTPRVVLYSEVCKNCHNTIPYVFRIFSQPLVGFRDARIAAAVDPLSERLTKVLGPLSHAKPGTASAIAGFIDALDPDEHPGTPGIGCESCHLGGREHAEHEGKIHFLPTSGYTRVLSLDGHAPISESRSDSRTMLGTCTQCHSGNNELLPNGAAKGNSREALDFHSGSCASQMSCIDCHDPHTASALPSGGLNLQAHIDVCTKCHQPYADQAFALKHSGHSAAASVTCLDCHMPRQTRGVDALIRTHRISHPVEASMVNAGSVNACNICHLDQSTNWTLQKLAETWNRQISIDPDAQIAGWLDQPVGEMWLESDDSHLRLMATQLYADSPLGRSQMESLLQGLNDPEHVNRVFAMFAAAIITGHSLEEAFPVDIADSPANRQEQIDNWLRQILKDGR